LMRGEAMTSIHIDWLCWDWLHDNYGEEVASEYTSHSLLIPAFNSTDLNSASEELRQTLYLIFGPKQSFGSTDYYEAKAAVEAGEVTQWPRCEICGLEIKGKSFAGSSSGKYVCFECWNETV